MKEVMKGKLMFNKSLYIPRLTNITCTFKTFDMSSNGMKSVQMIAIAGFHMINPHDHCTVVLEEISRHVKVNETVNHLTFHMK